jgi:hypothetical protein
MLEFDQSENYNLIDIGVKKTAKNPIRLGYIAIQKKFD